MAGRVPLDSKYCKAVNCHWRSGNKCTLQTCQRVGCLKLTYYFINNGHLADKDIPEE